MKPFTPVVLAFTLSTMLTIVFILLLRPSFVSFVGSFALQLTCFTTQTLFYFLFLKTPGLNKSLNVGFFLSFILSYLLLIIILLRINDPNSTIISFIVDYHKSTDFWVLSFPYIVSCIVVATLTKHLSKASNSFQR